MKIQTVLAAGIVVCAISISAFAGDTPSQAAARAALEKELGDLDHPPSSPAPANVPPRPAAVATNASAAAPKSPAPVPVKAPVSAPAPVSVAPTVQTPPPTVKPAPVVVRPVRLAVSQGTNTIATSSGTVYNRAKVEKVEPDGITVSYEPDGGGIAVAKIYFDELSDDWRQRYHYNPDRQKAYEQMRNQAVGQWREQMISNYDAGIAARAAREQAEDEAEAQAKADAANKTNAAAMKTNRPPAAGLGATNTAPAAAR